MASRGGQAIGGLAIAIGLALGIFVNPLDGIWIAVIGGFLFSAATASLRQEDSVLDRYSVDAQ